MNYNPDYEKALKDYQVNQDYTIEPFAEPFRKEQYNLANSTLEKYLEGYKYIYNRLTDYNKEEFKFDTLDYLNKVLESQISSKFKNLFTKTSIEIESFEGFESYYIPFEKELFSMENFKNLAIIACRKLPEALNFFLADDDKYEWRFWNEGLICHDYNLRLSAFSTRIKLSNGFKLAINTDKENIIYSEMIEKYYSSGYNEGLKRWKNEFQLNVNKNPTDIYLKRIRDFYFNENFDLPSGIFYPVEKIRGCSFVKNFDYEKISLYGIKTLGYYTAITYMIDEFLLKSEINLKEPLSQNTTNKKNEHPEMFTDLDSYNLFLALWKKNKGSSFELAEFSFIYRMFYKEGRIHEYQKPEMFRKWLRQNKFGIDLDHKLKRLSDVNTKGRNTNYLLQKENLGMD